MLGKLTKITFITFTRNSASRIGSLLEHVKDIVDEIIVIDGYSSDSTVEIAKSYGARVFQRKPWGYADPDRMFALKQASHDLVLMLDDDERLCSRLKNELQSILDEIHDKFVAVDLLRVNLSKGKKVILAPYYPDRVIKIFKKNMVIFTGRVHDGPRVLGPIVRLPEDYYVIHLQYYEEEGWIKKVVKYAYFQSIQYVNLADGNSIRKFFLKLMPLSAAPYPLYLLSAFIFRRRPLNALSLPYTFKRAMYDSILHTLLKLRPRRRKILAKVISQKGFIFD